MLISVIILSWNRKEDILNALESVYRQKYEKYEVIVVDQGSTDDTAEMIEKTFPKAKAIRLHKNFGVPGGRNIGAKNAKGDILVFLDNDVTVDDENAFAKVIETFNGNPKAGIVGFKILDAYTKTLDMNSWVYQKVRAKDPDKKFYTYTYCGCAHAIRKDVFEKIGYYWDELFFGCEEIDFSNRALDSGYEILYVPNIQAYHWASNEKRTPGDMYECIRLRNGLWVLWRDMPIGYAIKNSIVRIMIYFAKAIYQKHFIKMLYYFLNALRRLDLFFNNNYRMSKKTFSKYIELSKKESLFKEIKLFFK